MFDCLREVREGDFVTLGFKHTEGTIWRVLNVYGLEYRVGIYYKGDTKSYGASTNICVSKAWVTFKSRDKELIDLEIALKQL